jgi:hypothetical protein
MRRAEFVLPLVPVTLSNVLASGGQHRAKFSSVL